MATQPLLSVVEALQHDLDACTASNITLSVERVRDIHDAMQEIVEEYTLDDFVLVIRVGDQIVGAVAVGPSPSFGDLGGTLAMTADQLQDHVIDALQRPWPRCPGHSHPLSAVERDGVAVWVCPLSGERINGIGALSESTPI